MPLAPLWHRLARDPIVRLAALVGALALALAQMPALGEPGLRRIADGSDIVLVLVTLWAFQGQRRSASAPSERSFWDAWSAGLGSWLIVRAFDAAAFDWPQHRGEIELVRSAGFVALYLFAAVALEFEPHAPAPHSSALRSLELRGVALLACGLYTYFALIPAFAPPVDQRVIPKALLYLLLDAYLALRLLVLLGGSAARPDWRLRYKWLLIAVGFWAGTDAVELLQRSEILSAARAGRLMDALWLPPFLALIAAARLEVASASEESVRPTASDVGERSYGLPRSLAIQAAVLPLVHFAVEKTAVLGPETQTAREACAFGVLILITGIAVAYQRRIEREFRELAAERVRAAETASRAKSQFLAHMSHELRTPLNGVLGATELLLQSELGEGQKRTAEILQLSAQSLLGIVSQVLDFSRIEAGKLQLASVPFDPCQIVEEVVEVVAEQARQKALELACCVEPEVPATVSGDPDRLRQILINLLGNAVKFTERGEVVVRVAQQEAGAGWAKLRFEVRDTGIGVPPEARSLLFAAFAQADATATRRFGGAGLGLAISRQLAQLMGGDVDFASEPGAGSRFWFTARFACAPVPDRAPAPSPVLRDLRALVVEDNLSSRTILVQQCAALAVDARGAANGAEALALLQEAAQAGAPYALALIDMSLPVTDGVELARSIKADAALASVRLILLERGGQGARPRDVAPGLFAGHLDKPVRGSRLGACLAEVVTGPPAVAARRLLPQAPRAVRAPGDRVLVVEDNAVNQEIAASMLRLLGYDVDVANDGREALRAVSRQRYDAILMDCMMPDMDGFQTTAAMRQMERLAGQGQHTPVIALTASATTGDRQRCLEAGMDDYLSKPFRQTALAEVMNRWLAAGDGEGPIDPATLEGIRSLGNDDKGEFLSRIIALYLQDTPSLLADLDEAASQPHAGRLREAAHRLKSSSASVGAKRLSRLCQELELRARSGELHEAGRQAAEIRAEYGRVHHALSGLEVR
jgi:signal transduction histidine kinase/CheY-like chemotaxis protein/HPt (histidine-containing phosphotransfer) domain-containing protein